MRRICRHTSRVRQRVGERRGRRTEILDRTICRNRYHRRPITIHYPPPLYTYVAWYLGRVWGRARRPMLARRIFGKIATPDISRIVSYFSHPRKHPPSTDGPPINIHAPPLYNHTRLRSGRRHSAGLRGPNFNEYRNFQIYPPNL